MMSLRPLIVGCFTLLLTAAAWADPLPSWSDGPAKARIIAFVDDVTTPGGADYVTPADRVAVFDNDGTLWSEQPVYFQLAFAVDRFAALAKDDPSIATTDALKAAAAGDMQALAATGHDGLKELIAATHSGLSVTAFQAAVRDWLGSARHPQTGLAYTDMVYQPMLELLTYLRDNDFATYIVSGGGIHFMRAFTEDAYGIAPEQIIGSTGKSQYEVVDGVPTIQKEPAIAFIDDGPGKPVGIDSKIGKRPVIAFGNSDGDYEMLEWTTAGDGPRLGAIIHHTDAAREFAYDRDSPIGKLARGLDDADEKGWLIVDMAEDWTRVWPKEP